MSNVRVRNILPAAIATGAGGLFQPLLRRSFQLVGTVASGAGAVSVDIEASNDGVNFQVIGTISLALSSTAACDGFASNAAWLNVRANVTSISGTTATVDLFMGEAA